MIGIFDNLRGKLRFSSGDSQLRKFVDMLRGTRTHLHQDTVEMDTGRTHLHIRTLVPPVP